MNLFQRFFSHAKTLFFNGLFTVIPLALTLFFINFAYNFVYKFFEPLRKLQPTIFNNIPGMEFVLATLLIFLLGLVLRFFFISMVVSYLDILLERIPLVRIVYSSAKILVNFFQINKKMAPMSKKVVLIQYPRERNYHIAFLLEEVDKNYGLVIPDSHRIKPNEKFYKVFMPHSPSPMTGYFFILPESDIINTEITFEEAIRSIVSCGLITPESLTKLASKE